MAYTIYPRNKTETIFYELNQIQYFLQKPWRPFMKKKKFIVVSYFEKAREQERH